MQVIMNEYKGPRAKLRWHHDHCGCEALLAAVGLEGSRQLRFKHSGTGEEGCGMRVSLFAEFP